MFLFEIIAIHPPPPRLDEAERILGHVCILYTTSDEADKPI